MNAVDKLLVGLGIDPGIIELPTREGTENYLEPTEDEGRYHLVTQYSQIRLLGDPRNCDAVDPVDGPYINLGYEVKPGLKVAKIEVSGDGEVFLTLKEEKE